MRMRKVYHIGYIMVKLVRRPNARAEALSSGPDRQDGSLATEKFERHIYRDIAYSRQGSGSVLVDAPPVRSWSA